MNKLELFHTLQRPEVREVQREDGSKAKQFRGYAIVFNEASVVMCDWWEGKTFREYIKPDAISQEMLDSTDIICTAFHNREKLLARHHADGTGTMKLTKDNVGVLCEFEFSDAPTAADIAASVERGDMPGMSFSFYEDDYSYTDKKGADGIVERTIYKIDSIFEVTVAANPAYPATTASCREAWEKLTRETQDTEDLEKAQREQEALTARLRREREIAVKARELEINNY